MIASEMMTHHVLTGTPDMSLALAWWFMEDHRIRHLPVVSEGRFVGLVTDRDIRSHAPSSIIPQTQAEINLYMGTTLIESCTMREVLTVTPETDIILARQQMLNGHFGYLPVLAQNWLVGMITEIDLLRGYLPGATPIGQGFTVKTQCRSF